MTEEEKWGHTIEKHVTISNDKLLARAAQPVRQTLFETEYRAVARFTSLESANDLVNQLLERNMVAVDAVASGTMSYAWFEEGFSSPTGEEAIVLDSSGVPTLRPTYYVGMGIVHNDSSPRGYSVVTAYLLNNYSGEHRR